MARFGAAILSLFAFSLAACSDKDDGYFAPEDVDQDTYYSDKDCDDADPLVYPDADELCDGIDNDCDGVIDSEAIDVTTWYPDVDGDGYGNDGVPGTQSCEDPSTASSSYTTDQSDCNDGDPEISPGAEEDCSDGVDNDCDGGTDVCDAGLIIDLASADRKLLGASAGAGAGAAVAGVGDNDGDGLDDIGVGAPDESENGSGAGAAYLVLGGGTGGLTLDEATGTLLGEASADSAGTSIGGGDMDGDGYADLFVGATGDDTNSDDAGAVYVREGPLTGSKTLDKANAKLLGYGRLNAAGTSLARVDDADGNGKADLLVGAPLYHNADTYGMTYLVEGIPSGEVELKKQDAQLQGEASGDRSGSAVADAGDVDGDGRSDLLIGAPGVSTVASRAGAAYLWSGGASGTVSLADADARLLGVSEGDAAGSAVAGVGDTDGDGLSDVLVGGYGADDGGTDAGGAWLVSGATTGDLSLDAGLALIKGEDAGDYAGYAVAGPGDLNGDGKPDLVVGAPYQSAAGDAAGAAYVIYGPLSGTFSLKRADAVARGEGSTNQAGRAVGGAGDTDGDGRMDLLVGSGLDDDGGSDAGAAWLLLGAGF